MYDLATTLSKLIVCECGQTGVKQSWTDAQNAGAVSGQPLILRPNICCTCTRQRWFLQPQGVFSFAYQFDLLIACGCGGKGRRIRQTFPDVLEQYPLFHSMSLTTLGFCHTCQYVCWYALPFVQSTFGSKDSSINSPACCPHCKGRGVLFTSNRVLPPKSVSRRISRIEKQE